MKKPSTHQKNNLAKRGGLFGRFARAVSYATGRPIGFGMAVLVIIVWGATGPLFGFSDTWQLVINTSTTIVTFLMVFLIQNTQNRESAAVQLKLDELIRAVKGAHTAFMDLEELTEEELILIKNHYLKLAEKGRHDLRQGLRDTGSPELPNI